MAKKFSFVAENVTPLSQNNRSSAKLARLRNDLMNAHNLKYGHETMIQHSGNLEAKVFYLHSVFDFKDADNISKPLWDSLNNYAYVDDKQIKYLETLKIQIDKNNHGDILELDLTNIDNDDLSKVVDFMLNPASPTKRILYVCVSDFESKKVRL
jgi:CTP:phosphocholine cytidylyltransferase-like protein